MRRPINLVTVRIDVIAASIDPVREKTTTRLAVAVDVNHEFEMVNANTGHGRDALSVLARLTPMKTDFGDLVRAIFALLEQEELLNAPAANTH